MRDDINALLPPLSFFAEALAGFPVALAWQSDAAVDDGEDALPQRAILTLEPARGDGAEDTGKGEHREAHLLLPVRPFAGAVAIDDRDHAAAAGLLHAATAHALAHLRYSPAAQPTTGLKGMTLAVMSIIEDARVERLAVQALPGMGPAFIQGLEDSLIRDELSFSALMSRLAYALMMPEALDDNYWVNKGRTLFEARAHDLHDRAAFREVGSILANDLGQMRVRFEPQQYRVPAAYRDDNSYLWQHPASDTPQSVQALQTDAGSAQAQAGSASSDSPQREDRPPEDVLLEPETGRWPYPEWDYRRALLRNDWCTVIERAHAVNHAGAATKPHARARQRMTLRAHAALRGARLRRQPEGEELDIDASIEHAIERRHANALVSASATGSTAGSAAGSANIDTRVFMRSPNTYRPVSLLVLLDLSASTAHCPPGATQSILDTAKSAALMLVQAAVAAGHRIAVHGFCSDTRARVHYYRFRDFDSAADAGATAAVERALRACQPRFSTRMGAAIRHAGHLLSREANLARGIVVMTDGAPSDIDVFDASYLIDDARMAVEVLRQSGIVTSGITIDENSTEYMQRMLGRGQYRVVRDPGALSGHLAALFARMARG